MQGILDRPIFSNLLQAVLSKKRGKLRDAK
jgi:hypothetical protein